MKIAFALVGLVLYFQSVAQDSAKAFDFWNQRNLPFARQAVDEWSSSEGISDATCWLLRARVYNELKNVNSDLVADAATEAFVSLKKANSLNSNALHTLLKQENYKLSRAIYSSYISDAATAYNAGIESKSKSLFSRSFDLFRKGLTIQNELISMQLLPFEKDTMALYNGSKAAIKAGREEEAANWCMNLTSQKMLSAQNISLEPAWNWLLLYYLRKKQKENFFNLTISYQTAFPLSSVAYTASIEWYKTEKEYLNALNGYLLAYNKFHQITIANSAVEYANRIIAGKIKAGKNVITEAKKLVTLIKGEKR